jgi:post-segregation antitoxin (ccd killing protein)
MSSPRSSHTVRRSVAIPSALVAEALSIAPQDLKTNFNQLVRTALEEFVARHREQRFAAEMERMARDPEIVAELQTIEDEFASAEGDGL